MNKNHEQAKQSTFKNPRDAPQLRLNEVFMRNKLSTLEYEMVRAINSKDVQFFQDLGCLQETDLNFELTSDGIFPLMLASALGLKSIVMMMLHNHNIQINKTDKFGINAFWIAACKGHVQILQCLSEAKIDIHQQDVNGRTALHIASKNGHMPVVEYLVRKHNMDTNATSEDGRTPLIYATKCDKPDLVSFLIKYGSEINVETKQGMTPLLIATKMNSKIMVKILVEKGGANINLSTPPKYITALLISVSNGNVELVNYFCDRQAKIEEKLSNNTNVVMLACWKGFAEVLRVLCSVLLRRGQHRVLCYENAINGYTALTYALLSQHFECAEILLRLKYSRPLKSSKLSARESQRKQLADGLSLGLNRKLEEEEYAEQEMESVVDINQQSSKDLNTTLHFCVMKRKSAAITFLVERGADINIKNKQHLSPKMLAQVIKFHHPSLEITSRHESTNLFREQSGTHTPIFHHLVSFGAKALQQHVEELQQQQRAQEQREELKKEVEFIKSEEVNRQPEDENVDNQIEGESKLEEHKEEPIKQTPQIPRVKTAAVLDSLYEGDDQNQSEFESKSDIGSDQQRYSQFSFSIDFKKSSNNGDGSDTKNGSKKRFNPRRKMLSFKHSTTSAATAVFPNLMHQSTAADSGAEMNGIPSQGEQNTSSKKILEDISEEQPSRSFSTHGIASRAHPKKESQFSSIRDSKVSLLKNDTELNEFDFSKEQAPPVYLDTRPEGLNSSDQIPRSAGVKSSSGESQNPTEEGSKKAGTGGPDPQSDSQQSFEAPLLPHNPEGILSPVQEEKNKETLLSEPADNDLPHSLSLCEQKEQKEIRKVGTHKSDQNLQVNPQRQESRIKSKNRDDQMAEESHDSGATVRTEQSVNHSQINESPSSKNSFSPRSEEQEDRQRPEEERSRRCSTLQNLTFRGQLEQAQSLEEQDYQQIGSLANTSRFSSPVNLEVLQKIGKIDQKKLRAKKQGSLPMERNEARKASEEEQNEKSDEVNFQAQLRSPLLLKESKPIHKKKSTRIEPEGQDPIPSSPPQQSRAPELNIESEEVNNLEEHHSGGQKFGKRESRGEAKVKRIELSLNKEYKEESNKSDEKSEAQKERELFKYRKSTDLQSQIIQSPKLLSLAESASKRLQQKAMIQVKNAPNDFTSTFEEGAFVDRSTLIPSPLKMMEQTSPDFKTLNKLKIQMETPKIPSKKTLGQIRSVKHVKHKSDLPASVSNLSPSKNLNMIAGILSPYINLKMQQQSESDKKKQKDVKSIYTDYRIKPKPLKTVKPPSLKLPALSTDDDEYSIPFGSKQNSHNNSVDISPLRSKFITSYGTPQRGPKIIEGKQKLSPRKDASPLFIPQTRANLLNQIQTRGQSVMERFQKIEKRISPLSIGKPFNNSVLEERVEQRRNQLKLGQELRSKIAVNLFKGEAAKLNLPSPPKIPQLVGRGQQNFKDQN